MKFIRILKAEENKDIPNILYHATYKPLLRKIKKEGLIPGKRVNWESDNTDYKSYIYLSDDPYVAESYAETSDLVKEDWLDEIVILQINTSGLDKNNFSIDVNNQQGDTFQYKGIIPFSAISIYEE